jgi:hypothetical protein
MKQTAVEWLINELKNTSGSYRGFNNIDITHDEIISKAKEMEKEQILNTYIEASPKLGDIIKEASERYYNETYGGNK